MRLFEGPNAFAGRSYNGKPEDRLEAIIQSHPDGEGFGGGRGGLGRRLGLGGGWGDERMKPARRRQQAAGRPTVRSTNPARTQYQTRRSPPHRPRTAVETIMGTMVPAIRKAATLARQAA